MNRSEEEWQNSEMTQKLKDYFEKRDDIVMAFLFGSFASGRTMYDSDVDVAVYFKPKGREIEWEEERDWSEKDKIQEDIENIVRRDVDLLVLNKARTMVAFDVLEKGIPIAIKDRALYWRFYLLVNSAAVDFADFVSDYQKIKTRSQSLSLVDKIRLTRTIEFLEKEMESYSEFKNLTWQDYSQDIHKKREVEHWLENIVNASIDIAKIMLASEKISTPETYKDTLKTLAALKNFDEKTAGEMAKLANLRNLITHEYLDIRWKEITGFIKTSEPLYKYLADFIKKKL